MFLLFAEWTLADDYLCQDLDSDTRRATPPPWAIFLSEPQGCSETGCARSFGGWGFRLLCFGGVGAMFFLCDYWVILFESRNERKFVDCLVLVELCLLEFSSVLNLRSTKITSHSGVR